MRVKLARLLVTRKNRTHPRNLLFTQDAPAKAELAIHLDDLVDHLRECPTRQVVTLIFTNFEERRNIVAMGFTTSAAWERSD